MFNEKQTNAYKNITAPMELRERVLNAEKQPTVSGKTSSLKVIRNVTTLAACICLVVAVGFGLNSGKTLTVAMNGTSLSQQAQPLSVARASYAVASADEKETLEIPLELSLTGSTDISVSDGVILNSSYEEYSEQSFSKEKTDIIWKLNADREETYTLEIESGKDGCTVMLIFNNAENSWTISCTNK